MPSARFRVAALIAGIVSLVLCASGCAGSGDSGTYLLKPQTRAGLELPAGFPADFPICPHATSKKLTWREWDDDSGRPLTTYTLALTGDPRRIHEWYVSQLSATGWNVDAGPSGVPASGQPLMLTALSENGVGVYTLGGTDSVLLKIEARRRLDYRPEHNDAVTWVSMVDSTQRRTFFLILAAVLAWLVPGRMMIPVSALVQTRRRQHSLDALVRSSRGLPWEPGLVARLAIGLGVFVCIALLGFPEWFPSTQSFILAVLLVASVLSVGLTVVFLVLARSRDL